MYSFNRVDIAEIFQHVDENVKKSLKYVFKFEVFSSGRFQDSNV